MADRNYDSAGGGTYTTLASALTAIAASDEIIFAKSTSSETTVSANMVQTASATYATPEKPQRLYSVNDFTSFTPTAGASIDWTTSFTVTFVGNWAMYGFGAAYTGANSTPKVLLGSSAAPGTIYLEYCSFGTLSSSTSSSVQPLIFGPATGSSSNDSYRTIAKDLTILFGHVNNSAVISAGKHSITGLVLGGNDVPTTLFTSIAGTGIGEMCLSDSDLSGYSTLGYLFKADSLGQVKLLLNRVKLHASTQVLSGTMAQHSEVTMVDCSSGDTSIQFAYYSYSGSVLSDSTVKASSSPLTDGVTEFSRKFTPTSTCGRGTPLTTDLILPVDDNESVQPWVDVLIGADGASALDNSQLWIEVSACTVDGTTLGTTTSTRAAILATPTAHANSNTPYNDSYTTPMTHTVQIPSAITARQTGYVKITVNLAYTTNPVYLGKYGR